MLCLKKSSQLSAVWPRWLCQVQVGRHGWLGRPVNISPRKCSRGLLAETLDKQFSCTSNVFCWFVSNAALHNTQLSSWKHNNKNISAEQERRHLQHEEWVNTAKKNTGGVGVGGWRSPLHAEGDGQVCEMSLPPSFLHNCSWVRILWM